MDLNSKSSHGKGSPHEEIARESSDASYDRNPDYTVSRVPTAQDDHRQRTGDGGLGLTDTALERIQTARSTQAATVGADPSRSRSVISRLSQRFKKDKPLQMGSGKPFPPQLDTESYVVEFDGVDDPLHPQNWPFKRKLQVSIVLGFTTFICVFASSIFSPAIPYVAQQFGVSREVGVLGISFYVLGFAFGPIFWAPFSELYGRLLPIRIAIFGFTIFSFAVATAQDLQTILICRFFGGLFASCPLAVVAAVFGDMYDNQTRGLAITSFALAVFTSPLMAPFIGGFIGKSYLGWRWMEYLPGIIGGAATLLCLFFFQETYPPIILVNKAAELRRKTKNWGIHAKQDEIEIDLTELLEKNFSRPLKMLFTEPIVFMLSVYVAFIYGILYLFLTAYPLVFQGVHGMTAGVSGLPFFGMIVGQVLAGVMMIVRQPGYRRKLEANNNVTVPEWRLPEMIVGGVLFSGGLFWFSWTGYNKDIHWIVPTLSGLFTGFGLMAIFLQAINYLVDAYLMFAASALAANTLIRSIFGAAFPLFATQMFEGMGIQWAGTLLAIVAAVLVPVPIAFYYYGEKIRSRSQYNPKNAMAAAVAAKAAAAAAASEKKPTPLTV